MELTLAVLILLALVACWFFLPAEKHVAHTGSAPAAAPATQHAS